MATKDPVKAKAAVLLVLVVGCLVAVGVLLPRRPKPGPTANRAAPSSTAERPRPAPLPSASAPQEPEPKEPFRVGIEAAVASDPDKLALVHRYVSSGSDSLWPIQLGVIIQ